MKVPLAGALLLTPTVVVAATGATVPNISGSAAALRFVGVGVGQQDRVRIQVDDNAAGADASSALDVGQGSFTIDFWLRGVVLENPTAYGGGGEYFDFRVIDGNMLVDRDIWGASSRDYCISVAGGRIRFGTGWNETNGSDSEHTIEGFVPVLDDTWRHVAVVRDVDTGRKTIYVDGVLDYQSPPNRSRDDISYPDDGDPAPNTPWGPYIVLAAEKHDAGTDYPSFRGSLDEFRVWNRALSPTEIDRYRGRVTRAREPGLVGMYRFEEGAGTILANSVVWAGARLPGPAGELRSGLAGNGEWVLRGAAVGNTAPVRPLCGADFNGDDFVDDADFVVFASSYDILQCNDPIMDPACPADLNLDAHVDDADFVAFAEAYNALLCP